MKNDILVFDQEENLLTVLSNVGEDGSEVVSEKDGTPFTSMLLGQEIETKKVYGPCPYWDAPHDEEVNGINLFEFNVPSTHPDAQHVVKENKVSFKDKDGEFQLFYIIRVEENSTNKSKLAKCINAGIQELRGEPIEDRRPQNTSLLNASSSALQDTQWSPGTIADLGINSTNYFYTNALAAIYQCVDIWGGEIRFRITIEDNQITGRYVDILLRRGVEDGKIFENDKDLINVKRTIISDHIKTAVYGRGKGEELDTGGFGRRLTFEDVEWSKANGDPIDKPLGQKWIGDPDVRDAHGLYINGQRHHVFGFFEDQDEEDPEELLKKTYAYYLSVNHPLFAYDMDAVYLANHIGYDHEKFRLGDTVIVKEKSMNPPLISSARIMRYKRYLDDESKNTLKLGNFLPKFTDTAQRINQLERELHDRKGIWDGATLPVTDDRFPDATPPTPTGVTAEGLYKIIKLNWNFDPSSYIAAYEVYASQQLNFTPTPDTLVWRGKSGGYAFESNVNQQWYFRIRAINTHGTASAFSEQITATTVRINADTDIQEYTITKSLLAQEAIIDSIHVGHGVINTAHVNELDANVITSGILRGIIIESDDGQGGRVLIQNGVIRTYQGNNQVTQLDSEGLLVYNIHGVLVGKIRDSTWGTTDSLSFEIASVGDGVTMGFRDASNNARPTFATVWSDRASWVLGSNNPSNLDGTLLLRSNNTNGNPYIAIRRHSGQGSINNYIGRGDTSPTASSYNGNFNIYQYHGSGTSTNHLVRIGSTSSESKIAQFWVDQFYIGGTLSVAGRLSVTGRLEGRFIYNDGHSSDGNILFDRMGQGIRLRKSGSGGVDRPKIRFSAFDSAHFDLETGGGNDLSVFYTTSNNFYSYAAIQLFRIRSNEFRIFTDFVVEGSKSAVVTTESYGDRLMYAVEAPDNRFIDIIEKTLSSGDHWIDLNPMFAETINGYSVFPIVQEGGQVKVLEVQKSRFRVKVSGGQQVNIACLIYGRRIGFEDEYMREVLPEEELIKQDEGLLENVEEASKDLMTINSSEGPDTFIEEDNLYEEIKEVKSNGKSKEKPI